MHLMHTKKQHFVSDFPQVSLKDAVETPPSCWSFRGPPVKGAMALALGRIPWSHGRCWGRYTSCYTKSTPGSVILNSLKHQSLATGKWSAAELMGCHGKIKLQFWCQIWSGGPLTAKGALTSMWIQTLGWMGCRISFVFFFLGYSLVQHAKLNLATVCLWPYLQAVTGPGSVNFAVGSPRRAKDGHFEIKMPLEFTHFFTRFGCVFVIGRSDLVGEDDLDQKHLRTAWGPRNKKDRQVDTYNNNQTKQHDKTV